METKTKQSPRFRRQEIDKLPLLLQSRDIEIIKAISEYRLLNSEQIRALFPGSYRGLLRRFQKLYHHGYLDRVKGAVSSPIVYALGNKGADLLSEIYDFDRGQINWFKKNQEVKEYYLNHTLQVTNFRATLTLALKNREDTKIISWFLEGALKDEINYYGEKQIKIRAPLIPDAFFTLEDQGDLISFFLEADRSTMTNQRFFNKMKAYWQYWKQDQHKNKLDIDSFRVLTITKSQERKENLREITRQADDKKTGSEMFWFTSEENYNLKDPETILKPIWQTPKDNALHHILE